VRGTLAAEGVGCGLSSNEGTALWTLGIYSMYFVTYIYHSRLKVGSTKTNNMTKLFLYLAFTHPCLRRYTIIIHIVHRDLFYILLFSSSKVANEIRDEDHAGHAHVEVLGEHYT